MKTMIWLISLGFVFLGIVDLVIGNPIGKAISFIVIGALFSIFAIWPDKKISLKVRSFVTTILALIGFFITVQALPLVVDFFRGENIDKPLFDVLELLISLGCFLYFARGYLIIIKMKKPVA